MLGDKNASLQLPALLGAQIVLLDALIDLGHQQVHAIKQGRMNELLCVLERRQGLVNHLTANALPLGLPLAEPQRCASRQQHSLAIARFNELLALEKSSEQLLSTSREQISQRLKQTVHAVGVADAYAPQTMANTQGGHLDLSSSGS